MDDRARHLPGPRRVLFLGGARSGKSTAAEARAGQVAGAGRVVYIATAPWRPDDTEWDRRVAEHRARRPAAWSTVETTDPTPVLATETGVVLLDCLALWLTAAMDAVEAWDDTAWDAGPARAALAARTGRMVEAWAGAPGYLIGVSNEVGMGVVPATSAGRRFRDELGRLNARLAAASDEVALVVAGRLLPLTAPADREPVPGPRR